MRYRNCPIKDICWGYGENNCDGCPVGEKFTQQARKIKRLKTEHDAMKLVAAALANELNMRNEERVCDKERVTLFELLEEIQRLKEWRFENCKHRTGWCRDKHSCESCHFAKTKEIKNG